MADGFAELFSAGASAEAAAGASGVQIGIEGSIRSRSSIREAVTRTWNLPFSGSSLREILKFAWGP